MLTRCYVCGGDIESRKTIVNFRRGRRETIFENVPAHICLRCGEKYLDAEVYHTMEELSEISWRKRRMCERPRHALKVKLPTAVG